uniref:Uncharacterized protein n=1 Tax=Anguilla anguilla TaxID=7936 RepID=A0A0E9PJK7_ANGAN
MPSFFTLLHNLFNYNYSINCVCDVTPNVYPLHWYCIPML